MVRLDAIPHLLPFFEALSLRPKSALALDYDGTLAPFHVRRSEAVPYPGVRECVRRILATGRTRLVLISGRAPEEVRELLHIDPAPEIWGVHGQRRLWPDGRLEMTPLKPAIQRILQDAAQWIDAQGFEDLVESKSGSIAVHFRGIPAERARAARSSIQVEWERLADKSGMSILQFDGGIELRPSEPNKGTAAATLLAELEPGTPLAYLGDDSTDEDAFRTLRGTGALTVLVRPEWRETAAEAWIRPPEELLEFLNQWLARTERGN